MKFSFTELSSCDLPNNRIPKNIHSNTGTVLLKSETYGNNQFVDTYYFSFIEMSYDGIFYILENI
jgi:hypothetical protein